MTFTHSHALHGSYGSGALSIFMDNSLATTNNQAWDMICKALEASQLPLKRKKDGSWYGENVVSDSDFVSISPMTTISGCGVASWSIHGAHMSGSYKDYERFSIIMDAFLKEAGMQ